MKLLELSPEDTQRSISTRRLYRVLCCGKQMKQIDVVSLLPNDQRTFGMSRIKLRCTVCFHIIDVDLILSYASRKRVWESLGI